MSSAKLRPLDAGVFVSAEFLSYLTWVRDLEVLDIVLLAEFVSNRGETYLCSFCESDAVAERWLFARVAYHLLLRYLGGYLSFRDLLKETAPPIYIMDMKATGECLSARLFLSIDEVPSYLLPAADVLHNANLRPDLRDAKDDGYSVLLDDHWSVDDFADFQGGFRDAYNFIAVLGVGREEPRARRHIFSEYDWRGGYVSRTFYQNLESNVRKEMQVSVDAIQYNSPGYMKFEADASVAQKVAALVDEYLCDDGSIRKLHRELVSVKETVKRDKASLFELDYVVERLMRLMPFIDRERLEHLTEGDTLRFASVLNSFLRRIERLARHVNKRRVTFL